MGKTWNGYGNAVLDGVSGSHRVSFYLSTGGDPGDAHICHHCDNKRCVNPDHLYAGDPQTNARDSVERGLSPAGERNGSAKLNAEQVIEIRQAFASGDTNETAVALVFGVTPQLVHRIVTGRIWKTVGGPIRRRIIRRRNLYVCSACGVPGHNKRGCTQRPTRAAEGT